MPDGAIEARSTALRERLDTVDVVKNAKRAALFWPIERKKEVDLRPLDTALRSRGVTLAYPAIDPETRIMTFREVGNTDELTPSELGFMAPPLTAPLCAELDLVLVPGLAFDDRGFRIGYGGGFYDQALPETRATATFVGVAFDFQLAADIPNDSHDVAVDIVVTDARVLTCSSS